MEEEQPHIALGGVAVNMDVVTQRVTGHRQAAVPGQVATQQAVDALALVEGIDPQPADQQQIGLAGFDHHPGGHAAFAVQVPAVGAHIGLGPQRALAHGARHCVDAGHAVGQQQRRLGHAHLAGVAVLTGKQRAEDRRDLSTGQHLQLCPIELGAGQIYRF